MKKFNVIRWSFNRDEIEHYDVLPYFRRELERTKKTEVPKTRKEMRTFVERASLYQFWGRCEYETICHGWPVHRNEHKLDVHEQIMMNIDIVTDLLFEELCNKERKK